MLNLSKNPDPFRTIVVDRFVLRLVRDGRPIPRTQLLIRALCRVVGDQRARTTPRFLERHVRDVSFIDAAEFYVTDAGRELLAAVAA